MPSIEINAHGRLEHAQTEGGEHGEDMLEDFCLKVLVGHPFGAVGEEIEFQRQSLCRGLQLAHHYGEALAHTGVMAQVVLQIVAEDMQVDHKLVLALHTVQPSMLAKVAMLFLGAKGDGAHVYVDGTLYTSASAVPHAAPVLE